jgi:hypothetical protein
MTDTPPLDGSPEPVGELPGKVTVGFGDGHGERAGLADLRLGRPKRGEKPRLAEMVRRMPGLLSKKE